jgi:hypothetical protein
LQPYMIRCPFYGFRWPERNPVLRYVGGNECGLDLGRHEACAMEVEKRQVDFFACPVAVEQRHMLYPAQHLIGFERDGRAQRLGEWLAAIRR